MLRIFPRSKGIANDPFCGIELGDAAKDMLTGFTGHVIARVEYLTGCNQLLILPESDKTNEVKDAVWFDVERVAKTDGPPVELQSRLSGADVKPPLGRGMNA